MVLRRTNSLIESTCSDLTTTKATKTIALTKHISTFCYYTLLIDITVSVAEIVLSKSHRHKVIFS